MCAVGLGGRSERRRASSFDGVARPAPTSFNLQCGCPVDLSQASQGRVGGACRPNQMAADALDPRWPIRTKRLRSSDVRGAVSAPAGGWFTKIVGELTRLE